tara:strand:- start:2301 stop:3872 length:1572 start_codon:yes stop_codon:yes gene_type:complete
MAIINAKSTYENPLTVVNTEANDVYLNAIRRTNQAAALDMERQRAEETARQKEANEWIKWTADNTQKNTNAAMDWMKEAGVNNPQLSSMIMEQINIMSDLEGQARQASTPEEQRELLRQVAEYKSRLTTGQATILQMKDAITAFNEDSTGSPNSQGNINISNPKALGWAKKMSIISGKNPGKASWFIDNDGDWAIQFEGPNLKEPSIEKANVFFGYEPGIIPESDAAISKALKDIGFYDGDKVAAKYLMTTNAEGQPVPNFEYIDVGEGRAQGINRTNMDAVVTNLIPILHSVADGYASDYYGAEAYWDNLPKNIQKEVNAELKRNGMGQVGDDLSVGNFQQTQLDDKSLLAIRSALILQAKAQVRPFNTVGSPVKKDKPTGSGGGSGSGSTSGFSVAAQDFINEIKNTPIEEIVQQLRNIDTLGIQKVEYNKEKNQVIIDDSGTEGGGVTAYDLDTIKDFDLDAIAAGTAGAGQFFMRWIDSKLGNTQKERAIKNEINRWLAKNKDPNSGNNLPPFLYENTN